MPSSGSAAPTDIASIGRWSLCSCCDGCRCGFCACSCSCCCFFCSGFCSSSSSCCLCSSRPSLRSALARTVPFARNSARPRLCADALRLCHTLLPAPSGANQNSALPRAAVSLQHVAPPRNPERSKGHSILVLRFRRGSPLHQSSWYEGHTGCWIVARRHCGSRLAMQAQTAQGTTAQSIDTGKERRRNGSGRTRKGSGRSRKGGVRAVAGQGKAVRSQ